jgi:hypothetical protein
MRARTSVSSRCMAFDIAGSDVDNDRWCTGQWMGRAIWWYLEQERVRFIPGCIEGWMLLEVGPVTTPPSKVITQFNTRRFDWFAGADNPSITFEEVSCPSEITALTGCSRL